jgi:hypothetical protein
MGRSFFLSECHALPMMTKKANALGGTVKSCASSKTERQSPQNAECATMDVLTSTEAQVRDNCRSEETESVEGVGEEKVLERKVPELPRLDGIVKVLLIKVLVGSLKRSVNTLHTAAYDSPLGANGPILAVQKSLSSWVKNLAVSG